MLHDNTQKIGAIIQARMSSTRLPGKVLMPLPRSGKKTSLHHIIQRLKNVRTLNTIIIATTLYDDDDAVAHAAEHEHIPCFRGSKEDVLGRYYHAAKKHHLDIIVRITADCPCVSPTIVEDIIRQHTNTGCDYTSNTLQRSYPRGYDVEVFSFAALSRSYHEATSTYDREHVTPYIYKTNSSSFSMQNVTAPLSLSMPEARVTLDTADDYNLLCSIYEALYNTDPLFDVDAVVALLRERAP